MIKANELRVGNHLFKYGEVVKIVEIGIKHKGDTNYYLRSENDNCGYWIDQFNPIPLTEEILLKCGFLKCNFTENHYDTKGMKIWKCNDMFLCDKNGVVIKSLHQLQNLYFALTNQELKIEL